MADAIFRRGFLKAAVLPILLGATSASVWSKKGLAAILGPPPRLESTKEETIRAYYSGWEKKQWNTIESLLTDDFTFTSPNDDNHIDKHAFKERCWSAADSIKSIKMNCVMVRGDDGFANYLLTTRDGKSILNTEYFRFTSEKIKSIEVYFGGKLGYPGQQA